MEWHEISITVPYEYVEPISYLFDRYGHGLSMEIKGPDEVLLRTYLQSTSRQRLAHIEVGVKLTSILQPLGELQVNPLPPDEDWQNAWKNHFTLLKLGRHLVIKPSWIDYESSQKDIVIELDPGLAFGTGYHPTTYTCLESLEELMEAHMTVLDLGTGSGILTIAAIKLGAQHVTSLDIDSIAINSAKQNLKNLGLLKHVTLSQGTLPHPQIKDQTFDIVVANISARAIQERANYIVPAVSPQGAFIASGIINGQRDMTKSALEKAGFSTIEERPREDWVSLICRL
ncbi:MAG: 50S ribosomal protein L11 methyltransferase [Chloroflexota bacterium]|nr:50S ribosomal protein L11 methyltransferase [Chloroflexota bacterium]